MTNEQGKRFYQEPLRGVTRLSRDFLRENLPKIGKVKTVEGRIQDGEYIVKFSDMRGNAVEVNGFSWGYLGEGCRGLYEEVDNLPGFTMTREETAGLSPKLGWRKEAVYEAEPSVKGFLWYGTSRYPVKLSGETLAKYEDFVNSARDELSKHSGGFCLDDPDTVTIYIAGNGWSLEGGS